MKGNLPRAPDPVVEGYLPDEVVTGGYVRSSILDGISKDLPLKIQVAFSHLDVVVITASGAKYDFARTRTGVTFKNHEDDDAMTANCKFDVTNGVTLCQLVALVNEMRATTSYFVWGNNCHDLTHRLCLMMGAPKTESFREFIAENTREFLWKLENPM